MLGHPNGALAPTAARTGNAQILRGGHVDLSLVPAPCLCTSFSFAEAFKDVRIDPLHQPDDERIRLMLREQRDHIRLGGVGAGGEGGDGRREASPPRRP